GDDWQAIYRFAGSDLSIMTKFKNYFGKVSIFALNETFRFNNKIAEASGKFILKNPSQIRKSIKTPKERNVEKPQVFLHWKNHTCIGRSVEKNDTLDLVKTLSKNPDYKDKTLQILFRYNVHNPKKFINKIEQAWQGEVLTPKTCHASKGLEADIVIINDLIAGDLGFPSEKYEDPILRLLLPQTEHYPYAEERRVFYVGMTRAKHQTHIIADKTRASEFAKELHHQPEYKDCITKCIEKTEENRTCVYCKKGKVVEKSIKEGKEKFYACSHYPVCKYKGLTCTKCNEGLVIRKEDEESTKCNNKNCEETFKPCPKCEYGILYKRIGKDGNPWETCHCYHLTGCRGKA
ncbi:MAG: 3'-5' exonuclease, partial [Parvibaculales bacterium]